MAGRGRLGVVEHVNRRGDSDQRPRTVSRALGTVGRLDADPVFGDGRRRDSQLVIIQGSPVNRAALISNKDD